MSASSKPSPLGALAATVLTAGLLGAPTVAFAAPTPTPSPAVSTAATSGSSPSGTPTASPDEERLEQPETEPSKTDIPVSEARESETLEKEVSESKALEEAPEPETPESETADPPLGDTRSLREVAAVPEDVVEAEAEEAVTAQDLKELKQAEELAAQAEGPAGIALTKTASPTRVSRVGQVVTYSFTATNTGALALDNVAITDDLEGLSSLDCDRPAPVALQPRERLSCEATLAITQDWLDFGDIDNFASAFGEFAGVEGEPDDFIGANAAARVTVEQRPSIALRASVSPRGTADAGDRLRYIATATNTGNVTLTAARITSSLDALDLDCDPSARATLAPGASIGCSGSYRVTNRDARRGRVSNELTARGERPYGNPDTRGDDVTDDTTLRVRVTKPAVDDAKRARSRAVDTGLADTGGPGGSLPVGAVGVAALIAGTVLLRRGLRD